MGRDAKRAKQARRDRRLRGSSRTGATATAHEVRTPCDVLDALAVMLPQPKTGDWRPDILGVDKLSLQAGPDAWPLLNGHRVTEEMCATLQADRPEQAGDFVFEDLIAMCREMGPPDLSGFAAALATMGGCSGRQLDHEDGSMSCSLGLDCPGVALPHAGWTDCRSHGPCAHCDGPPVRWECARPNR
ncbi:hypothetical protein ACFZAG_35520 [Streptomyces sp. NPDC012403]|uniref:hypothetical protein n=1 Tax=Streptomyces sp. NPDC012403 TaxID=3364831 RepID=UPI0036E3C73B